MEVLDQLYKHYINLYNNSIGQDRIKYNDILNEIEWKSYSRRILGETDCWTHKSFIPEDGYDVRPEQFVTWK